MNNYNTAICIVGICLVITALLIFINHLRTKKTIDTIENMLNEAAKGNFSEKSFDETRLSSLETRPLSECFCGLCQKCGAGKGQD